jgi:hypothetical protein
MKKFFIFLSVLVNVVLIGGIVFFTLTPTGKKMLKDYVTKVDTVETVDNTDNTDNSEEPETNSRGLTKEASINGLKGTYEDYKGAQTKNDVDDMNFAARTYNALAKEGRKTWKNFASLMEAEGLPESLPIIETN